jgi:hypothetical protein
MTCTATVTDNGSNAPPTTPTGTVTFSSDGAGTFNPPSCLLTTASTSQASCEVSHAPSVSGSRLVTGAYAGDADHGISQGSTQIAVASPAGPAPVNPSASTPTGKRAAALKKCKKKPKGPKRKKCNARAKRLPV